MKHRLFLIVSLLLLLATPAGASAASRKGSGSVRFRDAQARSDMVAVRLSRATPPSRGHHYEAWLVSDSGDRALDLGALALDAQGGAVLEWASPGGENLLATYSRFSVTEERDGAQAAAPSGPAAYAGQVEPELLGIARALLVAGPDTPLPDRPGLAERLRAEARALASEGRRALAAAQEDKPATIRNHDEALLNRLAGIMSGLWGDWDGDGTIEHASDTYGVTRYAQTIRQALGPAASAPSLKPDTQATITEMITATDNILDWAAQTRNLANVVKPASDAEAIAIVQGDIAWLTMIISKGADLSNDGKIEMELGEGGADGIYRDAQDLARISFKAV